MRKISNQKAENFMFFRAESEDGDDPFRWSLPPSKLELSSNEVHVWLTKLNSIARHAQQMAQCLNEDESVRAQRFHFEQDKERFILCRGALRTIIGRYLHIEPSGVRFSYGPHGKPYLEETVGDSTLRFNQAHSHELALYAFTRGREIGVDIEYLRDIPDAEKIAASFFSVRENEALQALPANQKQYAFFACWTRKEAYIKAIGKGLSQPLDQFEVSLAPTDPASLLNVEGSPEEASGWSLKALTPAPGYVAALAVEGHNWRPTFWQFPESTSEVHQLSQTSRIR